MKCMQMSIGIDVSKQKLDVYIPNDDPRKAGEIIEVANDKTGFRKIRSLARQHRARIYFEPTGGYEHLLIAFMHRFKVEMVYTPGDRVRHYAKSQNKRYKNDRIDARMISEFAANTELKPLVEKDCRRVEICRRFRVFRTYQHLAQILANKSEHEIESDIKTDLDREARHLSQKADKALKECIRLVREQAEIKDLVDRLCRVKGVDDITSIGLVAELPELGTLKDQQLSAMVGIAPMDKQSGDKQWKHQIWGGRKRVRSLLFNAAMSCIRWNTIIDDYYRRKRDEGHPHKWSMIPTMRKVLSLLNRIARDPEFVPLSTPTPKIRT